MNPGFNKSILPQLRPGDLIFYSGKGFVSWLIKIKTWSCFSHVETYLGFEETHAARESGVNFYTISFDNLLLVRRPPSFNMDKALTYCESVNGQAYDFFGLFRFFTLGKQSTDKQFCSEDATRLARAVGVEPFIGGYDADLVSPRDLATTSVYKDVLVHSSLGTGR